MPPRLFRLSGMPGPDSPRSWPSSRGGKQQRQRLGHQSRLLRSLYFQRVLGLHDHLPAFSRLEPSQNHAQPDACSGRDRSQKANLVDSVIQPGGGIGRDDADLYRKRSHHRQRQIAMRDRAAEWTFTPGSFDVDMNPLMVAGARRKAVDAWLVDRDPIGHAELLSDFFVQSGKGKVAHLFLPGLFAVVFGRLHLAVSFLQLLLVDLADARLGNAVDEDDLLRDAVFRDDALVGENFEMVLDGGVAEAIRI